MKVLRATICQVNIRSGRVKYYPSPFNMIVVLKLQLSTTTAQVSDKIKFFTPCAAVDRAGSEKNLYQAPLHHKSVLR